MPITKEAEEVQETTQNPLLRNHPFRSNFAKVDQNIKNKIKNEAEEAPNKQVEVSKEENTSTI